MATSICPKCENTSFEMAKANVKYTDSKLYFIQCDHCGSVVSVTEYYNIGKLIYNLAEKLNIKLD